jgi:hypothetical protein
MFETSVNESAQVSNLNFGRDLSLDALPCIAGTLDELYDVVRPGERAALA